MQNGPTWCKSSCHEVTSEFFITNTLDPPHWTLNSCFGVFCTIWMHLGPFGCRTKLSAKQAELVQKFVPRSRVLIFHNKHIRLAPLGPKPMFLCISYYLGAFGTVWLPYKTRCKTGRSGAKVRAMKSCQAPNPPNWAQNSCFIAFHTILVHLGPFGCITNSVQNGPNCCKSSCHEVASEFFATNAPDPPHWTLNSCFGVFRTIGMHLGPFGWITKSVQNGPKWW
jgi:hypothetical protein